MTRRGGRYTPPKRQILTLTADVPDDASPAVKEGLARRRLVATTGRCPCGAVLTVPDHLEPGALTVVAVWHEDDCPANDVLFAAALRQEATHA